MTNFKKFLTPVMVFIIAITFFSCNNGEEKKEEKKAEETPAPTVAYTPFNVAMIKHRVADFNKWKRVYLAHDSMRMAYGLSQFALGRGMDDSNMVVVFNKFTDLQKAKEFSMLPNLKETMQKAGVTGAPEFSYSTLLRFDSAAPDQRDRVMITHRVKNFDVWLKAYDAEGRAKRMENGLQDRSIGRSLDDSNMVHVVFVITDMAKAKARIGSEELKKIMTDAGVEGAPQIFYYRRVD